MEVISAARHNGLDHFSLPFRSALRYGYERIAGYFRQGPEALFPAYPPFGQVAASDIGVVFPEAVWGDEAQTLLAKSTTETSIVESGQTELVPALSGLDFTLPPFEHQYESLNRAYLYPRTALLLDCGLGKTKVTIDLFRGAKHAGEPISALVLAPSSGIVVNWANELAKHGSDLTIRTTATSSGNTLAKAKRLAMYEEIRDDAPEVLVTSYGCLVNDAELIKRAFPHTTLVCDESHYLQTPTSKRSLAVKQLSGCQRALLLSGTAAQGSPLHVYTQLSVLAPHLVGDLWSFKKRYLIMTDGAMCKDCNRRYEVPPESGRCWCGCKKLRKVKIVHGFRNLHVLSKIIGTVALRKTAEECLDLPPLRTIDVPYTPSRAVKKAYNALVKFAGIELTGGKKVAPSKAAQRTMHLLQVLSGFIRAESDEKGEVTHVDADSRMAAIEDLLSSIRSTDNAKTIIWGHFLASLDLLGAKLTELGIGYVRVDGGVKNREDLRVKFETDPECEVYLGQIQTGIGVDLVAANYVVYADLPYFSWAQYEQSLKRAHRIGQERPVTVYRLYAPNTIHEYVLDTLSSKNNVVQSLVEKNLCMLCKHAKTCRVEGIKPFDSGCKTASSSVAKMQANLVTL